MALNTILISDLEVVVERQECPCTKIEILLKSHRDCMLVPVPVYWVPVPLPHCMWVPVPVCVVSIPLPPRPLLFIVALLGASRQRLSSTAMIYICSLESTPTKIVHGTRKTCIRIKTLQRIKGTYSTQNESKT